MYILITTENCPKCAEMKKKLQEREMEYREIKLTDTNMAEMITELRSVGIFKTEMPILVNEVENDFVEWEEVEI